MTSVLGYHLPSSCDRTSATAHAKTDLSVDGSLTSSHSPFPRHPTFIAATPEDIGSLAARLHGSGLVEFGTPDKVTLRYAVHDELSKSPETSVVLWNPFSFVIHSEGTIIAISTACPLPTTSRKPEDVFRHLRVVSKDKCNGLSGDTKEHPLHLALLEAGYIDAQAHLQGLLIKALGTGTFDPSYIQQDRHFAELNPIRKVVDRLRA
ncbi:hypothetical protein QBC36DRAFT_360468 [Triangularia setosa]|uniref:Uncharacterized protein n=1 Tax=Triangularia setosa TaxID=2587417 RepID=A0AAN7A4R1_9PEZI|nr:hypothetical protein QBC36DRAFT_360468 [Podospora setosa]